MTCAEETLGHSAPSRLAVYRVLGRLVRTLCLAGAFSLSGTLAHGRSEQVPVGVRAIAMGGAYSAIADDASALFWNPAGLPYVGHQQISASRANAYGSELVDSRLGFVLPFSRTTAAALDWYHAGLDDPELGFGENRFDLGLGRQILPGLSLGASIKYLDRSTELDGSALETGSGFGIDLGALVSPLPGLRLGVVAQDVTDTQLRFDGSSVDEKAYPRNVRIAASYEVGPNLLTSVDVDDRLHAGIEFSPVPQLALRAGIQHDNSEDIGPVFSAGAGIRAGVLRFDYAYEDHPVLESTHHLGLSMDFNFNPARIRIEQVDAAPIFSSLYKLYAKEPLGEVAIRNLDDEPLPVTVRVFIPDLMDRPSEENRLLAPSAVTMVPLTAVVSERVLKVREHRQVQAEISVTYQSRRLARTERTSKRIVSYGSGALAWGDGVDQAAAFVTTRDPVVENLARDAAGIAASIRESRFPTRNLAFASAIFAALRDIGVAYLPDPNNAYASVSTAPRSVDTVHYPRETLARGGGDCDDTTVLLTSLLGNIGVRTQWIDVPGHIFLLMDTGIPSARELALSVADDRYVHVDGRVWIPLETTAIGDGFVAAWEEGAQSYASWASQGSVTLVDVLRAQERYDPPSLGNPNWRSEVSEEEIRLALETDGSTIEEWQTAFLGEAFPFYRSTSESDLLAWDEMTEKEANDLAKVLFLSGKFEQARSTLERIDATERKAQTLGNLAAIHVASGDVPGAEAYFRQALLEDDGDPGLWLNLGLLRSALADSSAAQEAIRRSLDLAGGANEAFALLGLPQTRPDDREGRIRLTLERARTMIQEIASALFTQDTAQAQDVEVDADPETEVRRSSEVGYEPFVQEPTETPDPADASEADTGGREPESGQVTPQPRAVPSMMAVLAWSKADEPIQIQHVLYWKDE